MGRKNKNEGNTNDFESIKIECAESFKALRQGKQAQALKMTKNLCSKHRDSPHSAYVYYARLNVLLEVAKLTNDPNAKTRYFYDVKETAEIAVRLSPNSIILSQLYACVSYGLANEKEDYEKVVEECKRALAVENPVDPAEEGMLKEKRHIMSAEDRIEFCQYKLRNFIQMSNIASISTWMHNLGKGEGKFNVVRITRDANDPMVQTMTRDEIEKTGEEMELRHADDRIMQNRSESLHLRNDVESTNNNRGLERSSPGSTQRPGERRKSGNARETTYSGERMDCVRSYWNSTSSGWKKDFLRIKILDLEAHFSTSKNGSLSEVLKEALLFGQANKVWKFWVCYLCNKRSMDIDLLTDHVKFVHLARFVSKMKSSLPHILGIRWAKMLLSCQWKPLELNDAMRILMEKLEPESSDISDDPERAKLLKEIHAVLQVLIKHKYLASSHLRKVTQDAVAALRGLEGGPQLLEAEIHKTPLCICVLGARELDKILRYLKKISHACGISPDESNITEENKAGVQRIDIIKRVTLSQDCSVLVLDERSLPCEVPRSICNDAVSDDSSSATTSHIIYDNDTVLDSDALLSWIFSGPPFAEQLATWRHVREEKPKKGLETLKSLEKNLDRLNDMCNIKYENLRDKEALQTLEDLCFRNRKEKRDATNFVCQSYETVLQDRREELIETVDQIESHREFVAIKKVLNDVEIAIKSQLCVPESGEIDNCRTNDYLQQVDSRMEVAIRRQREQVSIELGEIDAMIMVIIQDMKQLKDAYKAASFNDYESILIPLLKSFLRACLEDLAEKDTRKKSDAAKKALLAETALKSKEIIRAEVGHPNLVNDKDLEVTNSDESHAQQSAKKILFPRVSCEEGLVSRIALRCTDDDGVLLQDEEYKQFIEQSLNLRDEA